jgi:anthranilate synthase component 1
MKPPFDIPGDLDTPVSAFRKLAAFEPRFLLESVEGGERLARYSFIGFGDCLEVKLDAQGFKLGNELRPIPRSREELLGGLRDALRRVPVPQHLPARPAVSDLPALHYVAPQSLLVFDHLTRGIALVHAGSESERQSLRGEVIRALRGSLPNDAQGGRYAPPETALAREAFMQGVARVQDHIAAGDVYQLVLAVRFAGRHALRPFEAYRALRLINPSPYMFYCALDDVTVVGSSPEALVKLTGGQAQLRPIAGTRPRSEDDSVDAVREAELRADPKENAEHVMLVDLARNDLGRVARPGTVRVEPYRSIERYSHVMHIVSGVHGTLEPGHDAFDLFAAAFPAGTLVGAPKVRAMQLIDELEPVSRGLYGGTVGYFGARGDMDQAITIRTLVFRGDEYSYQAGAGIVADSVPAAEHDEVLAKSAALVRALSLAQEGL